MLERQNIARIPTIAIMISHEISWRRVKDEHGETPQSCPLKGNGERF